MSPTGWPRRNTFIALKSMIKWEEGIPLSLVFSLFFSSSCFYGETVYKSALSSDVSFQIGSDPQNIFWNWIAHLQRRQLSPRVGKWLAKAISKLNKGRLVGRCFASISLDILPTLSILNCLRVLWGEYHCCHLINDKNKTQSKVHVVSKQASFFEVFPPHPSIFSLH